MGPSWFGEATVHWASREVIAMCENYDGWDLEDVYGIH